MQRTQSGLEKTSALGTRRASSPKTRRSISRGPSQGSRQQPLNQQRHHATMTVLQRRERLRVYDDEGEDATPKTLVHPEYSSTRRTAFDAIAALASSSTAMGGSAQPAAPQRPSLATVSSFSSVYTLDEILAAKAARLRSDSLISSTRDSSRGSLRGLDAAKAADLDGDAPSQYHLSRIESQGQIQPGERITLTLRETDTFFLFELAQLTEDATTEIGEETIAENERYEKLRGGAGRKSLDAESQTPQVYVKSRSTCIARQERKNRSTYVNNWVMHDDYEDDKRVAEAGEGRRMDDEESNVKFPERRADERPSRSPDQQLAEIGEREAYEDATRVVLRVLASRDYESAQKRFAGLLRQDPCDPNLRLVYGLELLWKHTSSRTRHKAVAAFKWNPANASLLAVGYETRRWRKDDGTPRGLVFVWCAKNPDVPDRRYEFDSAVSDLDWSRARPNLLAVGFYDGCVRVIDASKKQLCVVWEAEDRAMPSFEPHWQICIWDLRRKSHRPASTTKVTSARTIVVKLEFTRSGEQLVAADDEGVVYVYGLEGMPLPALDESQALVDALHKSLVTKPELLRKLQKLGPPFDKV